MPVAGRVRYIEAQPGGAARRRGTLVLLHAFPLNARMWEPQLALSERGWHVVAPQFRGFDRGEQDPPASSVDDYAGDVVDVLDALHVREAVVAGLSMGGYVALALFRHAARYFQGLVLADTRAEADTPAAIEGRRRMIALAREQGPSAIADDMIPELLGETTRETNPRVAEHVRSLVLASSTAAIADALAALMTRPDSTSLLNSIHCPTLVIVGGEDTITPKPFSEALQAGIAGAQLEVVPRAGHLSSLEQPVVFNEVLSRFLERHV